MFTSHNFFTTLVFDGRRRHLLKIIVSSSKRHLHFRTNKSAGRKMMLACGGGTLGTENYDHTFQRFERLLRNFSSERLRKNHIFLQFHCNQRRFSFSPHTSCPTLLGAQQYSKNAYNDEYFIVRRRGYCRFLRRGDIHTSTMQT